MADGNWPHGPNYFGARRVRHWAKPGRPPPIGLPANQMGLAPGTPVVFGDRVSMGYPQTVLARAQKPPRRPLTMAGMQGASGCSACEAGVSPPGWERTVEAMKAHPEITNPWALAWWMRGRGAGQLGGEFAYVTDRPETTADVEVVSPGPQPYAYIGVHPAAVPYYQAGERPPSPCAGLIQFESQADWLEYRTWWERYYGDAGPCPPPVFAAPEPIPTVGYAGPPSAEPPPTVVDEVERGPGAPLLAPELTPATVLSEPEPELEPRRVPWAWLVGGTAAAGAIAAGVAYALHRKKKRRRRG